LILGSSSYSTFEELYREGVGEFKKAVGIFELEREYGFE